MAVQEKFCQSCGMPMDETALYGSMVDGAANDDYCMYCYERGEFTSDVTMDEMIALCVPHMVAAHPEMSAEKAETLMREYLPQLKRWKK